MNGSLNMSQLVSIANSEHGTLFYSDLWPLNTYMIKMTSSD